VVGFDHFRMKAGLNICSHCIVFRVILQFIYSPALVLLIVSFFLKFFIGLYATIINRKSFAFCFLLFVQFIIFHFFLYNAFKKTRVCKKKTSSLRLAKRQKAEFTGVNEHFCCQRNEKIGVFLQTLYKT